MSLSRFFRVLCGFWASAGLQSTPYSGAGKTPLTYKYDAAFSLPLSASGTRSRTPSATRFSFLTDPWKTGPPGKRFFLLSASLRYGASRSSFQEATPYLSGHSCWLSSRIYPDMQGTGRYTLFPLVRSGVFPRRLPGSYCQVFVSNDAFPLLF